MRRRSRATEIVVCAQQLRSDQFTRPDELAVQLGLDTSGEQFTHVSIEIRDIRHA